jgi:hypothetical protein
VSTTPTAGGQRATAEGWASFVAVYLLIVGVLNVVWGIAALANKAYFVSGGLLWSELKFWGWAAIILGAIQMLGSALVAARNAAGAVIAGTLAFCGIILNFLSIGAYPVWSVILLLIDALILWGVTVHADEFVKP